MLSLISSGPSARYSEGPDQMEMKRSACQPLQSLRPICIWLCRRRHFGNCKLPASAPLPYFSLPPSRGWKESQHPPPPFTFTASPLPVSNLILPVARQSQADPISSMAGGKSTGNAARTRKRVEATVLKRSRDGSAFTRCEACNKDVPVVLIDMHSCSLDAKIRMTLEAQVVEKTVEVTAKADRKKPAAKGRAANKDSKRKRTPTAFFLFLEDFRKEFKAANPDNKSVSTAAKEAGEKWRSMTDQVSNHSVSSSFSSQPTPCLSVLLTICLCDVHQEKKPYVDKATELKALAENGEGSGVSLSAFLLLLDICICFCLLTQQIYDAGEQCRC
ncbi:unnamed protein product [Urochloa decumbens]|uniref:HMG box domain-containing protein n=1 Tax=Urochloa decumbens TaxID=240449 RepID=A0ABC9BVU8_9POAL